MTDDKTTDLTEVLEITDDDGDELRVKMPKECDPDDAKAFIKTDSSGVYLNRWDVAMVRDYLTALISAEEETDPKTSAAARRAEQALKVAEADRDYYRAALKDVRELLGIKTKELAEVHKEHAADLTYERGRAKTAEEAQARAREELVKVRKERNFYWNSAETVENSRNRWKERAEAAEKKLAKFVTDAEAKMDKLHEAYDALNVKYADLHFERRQMEKSRDDWRDRARKAEAALDEPAEMTRGTRVSQRTAEFTNAIYGPKYPGPVTDEDWKVWNALRRLAIAQITKEDEDKEENNG